MAFSIKQLFYLCNIFLSDRKWHTVAITSLPSFQSLLTFIFVKQIALNMSKTFEWSGSQILKIQMIHKGSARVYSHHDKISRGKKSQPSLFRAQTQGNHLQKWERNLFFLFASFPRDLLSTLAFWGWSVTPVSMICEVATRVSIPAASGVCSHYYTMSRETH